MKLWKTMSIILCLMFSLTNANSLFAASQVVDGPVARNHLKRTVQKMLYQEKFAELEKMANEFRKTKARLPEGLWKLHYFYEGVTRPRIETDERWQFLLNKIEKWQKQYPESITARVAAGAAWLSYGWFARGQGNAGTVKDEGWRLLAERVEKSRRIAEKAPKQPADDCPERYLLLLKLAKVEGLKSEAYERAFRQAVAFEPSYYDYYLAKADNLLPRWHGEEGDWQRFAKESVKLTPATEGSAIYARLLGSMWLTKEFSSFNDKGVSWPLMKEGFHDTERVYPSSAWNLNNFCKYACIAGDREMARDLFKRIGDHPYIEAWKNIDEFVKWRKWAGFDNKLDENAQKPSYPDGTEDFRQMLQVAQEGDAEAQYRTGIFYARGEQVARDDAEAAKWHRKAAEQGHADAQTALAIIYFNGFVPIKRDYPEALKWSKLAAMQGDENGASMIGQIYYAGGNGVEKNLVHAYAWFSQITRYKDQHLVEIAGKLTQDQLKQGEQESIKLKEVIRANKKMTELSEPFTEKPQRALF